MSRPRPIVVGTTFGYWTTTGPVQYGNGAASRVSVRCHCGTERLVAAARLRRGQSRSCGCFNGLMTAAWRSHHGGAAVRAIVLPADPNAVLFDLDGVTITAGHEARFRALVVVGAADACWSWLGAPSSKGYGRLHAGGHKGRLLLAHRLSLSLAQGHAVPRDLVVRHRCDNPICVNPAHLLTGTHLDNMRDAVERGRTARGVRSGVYTHPESRTKGERNAGAKLTATEVGTIRARHAAGGLTYAALAAEYGVSPGSISNIVRGKRWAA